VNEVNENNKSYYIKVALENVKMKNDNVVIPENDIEINETQYKEASVITHIIEYDNFIWTKTCREIDIVVASAASIKYLMLLIWQCVKKITFAVENAIKNLFTDAVKADEALQATEIELHIISEQEIVEGAKITVEEAVVDETAIASDTLFIDVCVVIAAIFIVLFFILHNIYHHVRIWNLTKYKMSWDYFIDHIIYTENKITQDSLDFKIDKFMPISAASSCSHISSLKGNPEVHYGDLDWISSNESIEIEYTLQLYLKNSKTDHTVYTVTTYYNISFERANSTNLTFDNISDPHFWFKEISGDNRNTFAETRSGDGKISATSSYDYLKGKHGVPSQTGGSSNEAY
jgi:hypothetical protein